MLRLSSERSDNDRDNKSLSKEIMKRNLMKMATGCLSVVMLLGLTGCSSTVKNETVEEAYMSLYDGVIKDDFGKIEQVMLMNDEDKQQLEYNFAGLNLENTEIVDVAELYSKGIYSVVAITSRQDYDIVEDKPMLEIMFAKKADDGYYFLGNGYSNASSDKDLKELLKSADNVVYEFQQSQNFWDYAQEYENFATNHQQELVQWEQQLRDAQQAMQNQTLDNEAMKQAENAAKESQRMTENTRIQAENAANQALNNNAPVQPMQ